MSIRDVFVTMTRRLGARREVRRSAKNRRTQALLRLQVETLESRTLLSVLTVTTSADSGPGSLRQAILDANANPGLDTIAFNIGGGGFQSIQPTSPLPTITDPVFLDGTTQPQFAGTPLIELNGTNAGAGVTGLTITAGNSTVRGLVVNRFKKSTGFTGGDGIDLLTNGGNVIEGNFIGTNATGTAALGNDRDGIRVALGSQSNQIGTNADGVNDAAERNVIAGGADAAVRIQDTGTSHNVVAGNYIGTNAAGTASLGNVNGVYILAPATDNTVGGSAASAGNVIAGSSSYGVFIGGAGSTTNVVAGNFIGTNAAGTASLLNAWGLFIAAGMNTVGGVVAGARNLISGNNYGIYLLGNSTTGNVVQGNFIGTDVSGTANLGNTQGIYITSSNNMIGGTTAAARNLISGNRGNGIYISGSSGTIPTGNAIQGNRIGTDMSGSAGLGNGNGVVIDSVTGNTVGGTTAGASNLISANKTYGVRITGSSKAASANLIEGNLIGTNAAGTASLGNYYGVYLDSTATNNTIGGTATGAGNLISGNARTTFSAGIYITITGTGNNLVQGNLIGTDLSGTTGLGNTTGIYISSGSNNTIGGVAIGAANTIAFNSSNGVTIVDPTGTTGDAIRGNAIFANGGLGIDLGNDSVTLNNSKGHTGPNNYQNFPVLTAFQPGATTQVSGTLNSTANTSFALDFYANAAADPSGYGQGQRYLGSTTVQTDANVNATFAVTLAAATSSREFISATASDSQGNTSEFSADRSAVFPTLITLTMASGTYGGTTTLIASLTSEGNPVSGRTLAFTLNGVSVGNTTTDANGRAAVSNISLASLSAGSYAMAVGASFSGDSAYSASSGTGSLTVNPAPLTITANAVSKVYGQANPTFTVSYIGLVNGDTPASLSGSLTFTTSATTTSHAGSYTVTPGGLTATNYTISFVAGTLTVTPAPLTITPINQMKEFGAPLPPLTAGYSGFVNGDGPASLNPGVTLSTPATAASPVGTYPIIAAGAGSSDYTITYGSGTLTIFPAASHFLVAGFPSPITAGTAGTLTITARGASNATVTGYLGTIHFRSSDPQAVLPPDYTFTTADHGVHTFSITLKTAGTRSVTVTDTALPGETGTQAGIAVHPAAATLIVSGFPSPITAGKAGTLTVTARDPYGNVAAGYRGTVHVSSSDPKAVLPPDFAFTAGDAGIHTFTIHLKTAGSQSITATDKVTATLRGTQTGIVVTPAAARMLAVTGFPSPVTAGTPIAFTVTVRDAYGNTVTGYTGTVHFRSSDSQAVLPANYTFIQADHGTHTFTVTLKTAAVSQSLTVQDTRTRRLHRTQSNIVVNPAATSRLVVFGFPSPIIAGTSSSFRVEAVDPYGNLTPAYRGTIHFSSSDPQALLPGDYTFTMADSGRHLFRATLKTPGTQSITAIDTAMPRITGSQTGIMVAAGSSGGGRRTTNSSIAAHDAAILAVLMAVAETNSAVSAQLSDAMFARAAETAAAESENARPRTFYALPIRDVTVVHNNVWNARPVPPVRSDGGTLGSWGDPEEAFGDTLQIQPR